MATKSPSARQPKKGLSYSEWRTYRFRMRRVARDMTSRRAVMKCGTSHYDRFASPPDFRSVKILEMNGRARIDGTIHCKNPWECPTCAEVQSRSASELLRQAVNQNRRAGGGSLTVTLTLPHEAGDALRPMQRHVAEAWGFVQSGAPWIRHAARLGIVGVVRTLEITHGPNGWHPHLHVLIFTANPLDASQLAQCQDFLYQRWARAIGKPNKLTGVRYGEPSRARGVVVRATRRADYLGKWGATEEMLAKQYKAGRAGHRNPWQILRDVVERGGARDRWLWREYCTAMKGAKQLTFSRGFKTRFALAVQVAGTEQLELGGLLVAEIEGNTWNQVFNDRPRLCGRLLELAESGLSPPHLADWIEEMVTKIIDQSSALWSQPLPAVA